MKKKAIGRILAWSLTFVMVLTISNGLHLTASAEEGQPVVSVQETVTEEKETKAAEKTDSLQAETKQAEVQEKKDTMPEQPAEQETTAEAKGEESSQTEEPKKDSEAVKSEEPTKADEPAKDPEEVKPEETKPAAQQTESETVKAEEAKKQEKETASETIKQQISTRKTYQYEDTNIKVTAVLQKAEAIPDDAELVVTPITEKTTDYNYDAYMDALNNASSDVIYTAENTLLYDVAFMIPEKNNQEQPTGKLLECQPEDGSVKVSFQFKKAQLSDEFGADAADNIEIIHLPLKSQIRDSVNSTKEATQISASDIKVEPFSVAETSVSLNGAIDSAVINTDSFSTIAFTVPDDTNPSDDYKIEVKYLDAEGNETTAGNIGNYYVLVQQENGIAYTEFPPASDWTVEEFTDLNNQWGEKISFDNSQAVSVQIINAKDNDGKFNEWETFGKISSGQYNNYPANSSLGNYVLKSIDTSDNNKAVITLQEKPNYKVTVNIYDFDGSTPYDAGVSEGNYFVRVTAEDEAGIVYYAVKPIDLNGSATPSVSVPGFIALQDKESDDWRFDNGSTPDGVPFDPSVLHVTDVRIINSSAGNINSDKSAFEADSNITGFHFISNDTKTANATVKIQRWNGSKLVVELQNVDQDITPADGYWVWVALGHQSTGDTFFATQIDSSSAEDGVLSIDVDKWYDQNGDPMSVS